MTPLRLLMFLGLLSACGGDDTDPRGDTIGADGGAVANADGNAAVIVPPGAVPDGIAVGVAEVTETLPNSDVLLGSAYQMTPDGARFDIPVVLSLAIPPGTPGAPVIVTLDEVTDTWQELPGSLVTAGRVFAQTTHFSFYGVSLPAGPVDACREMQAMSPPNTVHPMLTPNSVSVSDATKTATLPSGFSGPNPLELGTTWTGSQRFVEVTGNGGVEGTGAWIDYARESGGTFEVAADGRFSLWLDLHEQGPFYGLTDACTAPGADERGGWLYSLNVHCDQSCIDDSATMPPTLGGSCGPTELCMRSIDECSAPLTQPACEGWYADRTNCRDMDMYTSCNCRCIGGATCTDYFDCGQVCFDTHCM